jgi:hypothetical protein
LLNRKTPSNSGLEQWVHDTFLKAVQIIRRIL